MTLVRLRPLAVSDLPRVLEWRHNEAFWLANGWPMGLPAEQLQDWFVRLLNNPPVDLVRKGVVVNTPEHPEGYLVGFVDLLELNPLEKRARLHIAIGEEGFWEQGVGYAAGSQMLEHGFSELSLERITAEVQSSNRPMLHLLEKLGFQLEGILRQHVTRQGVKQDLYLFGMLHSEFKPSSSKAWLEAPSSRT